jgi:hypothetical protein
MNFHDVYLFDFLSSWRGVLDTTLCDTITPYIRMLSSGWLMKGVFVLPILSFFSFSAIAGVFA